MLLPFVQTEDDDSAAAAAAAELRQADVDSHMKKNKDMCNM